MKIPVLSALTIISVYITSHRMNNNKMWTMIIFFPSVYYRTGHMFMNMFSRKMHGMNNFIVHTYVQSERREKIGDKRAIKKNSTEIQFLMKAKWYMSFVSRNIAHWASCQYMECVSECVIRYHIDNNNQTIKHPTYSNIHIDVIDI